jgi:DNA topoisomerase-1
MVAHAKHKYAYRQTINAKKKLFKYVDASGKPIHDKSTLEYIRSIYIPPAYKDVEINLSPTAKIRIKGTDEAGRRQYLYNPQWTKRASDTKYCRIVKFGEEMPKIQKDILHQLDNSEPETKERMIALIIYIIMTCNFRIGNRKFRERYNSYGVSTLTKKQVKIKQGSIFFDFIGKKGVPNQCLLKDKKVVGIIKRLYNNRKNSDDLFMYSNGDKSCQICSNDINEYLKKYGGFSSKDFRTWMANVEFIKNLRIYHQELKPHMEKERKKVVSEAVIASSIQLHHTPAICRKSYISGVLINDYIGDERGALATEKGTVDDVVLKNLRKFCKKL